MDQQAREQAFVSGRQLTQQHGERPDRRHLLNLAIPHVGELEFARLPSPSRRVGL